MYRFSEIADMGGEEISQKESGNDEGRVDLGAWELLSFSHSPEPQ